MVRIGVDVGGTSTKIGVVDEEGRILSHGSVDTRTDLPFSEQSGLEVAVKVLKNVDDIRFCYLTSRDVVRHPLVQKIVKAYEAYEEKMAVRQKARAAAKHQDGTRAEDKK